MTRNANKRKIEYTDSTDGLKIPFGRDASNKVVYYIVAGENQLAFDGIVIGTMNSGKTNFLNTLITLAAKFYSPEELNIYLLDYKIGVTSKMYDEARLPHIKRLIMTQSPEDGCAVLKSVKREIDKRSALFEEAGCEKIEDYNKIVKIQKLPRILVIIDEAHILFNQNNESCELMLDMITTARSFGIHFILSTQSLSNFKNSNEQIQDIIRYLYIRIAFSCRDRDAEAFFGDSFNRKIYQRPENSGEGYITSNYADYKCTPLWFRCAYQSNEERTQKLKEIAQIYLDMGFNYEAKVYRFDYQPKITDIEQKRDSCIHLGTCAGLDNDVSINIIKGKSSNTLIYTLDNSERRDNLLLLYVQCIVNRLNQETEIVYYNSNSEKSNVNLCYTEQVKEYSDFQALINYLDDKMNRRTEKPASDDIFVIIRDFDYLLFHSDYSLKRSTFLKLVECGFLYGIRFVISACTSKFKSESQLMRLFPELIAGDMSTTKAAALFNNVQPYHLSVVRGKEMWYSNLDISDEVMKIIPYLPERIMNDESSL